MKEFLNYPQYDFLRTNSYLKDNIILLTYSGSIAYGTNLPTSDTDIRGAALRNPNDILLTKDFEQIIDKETDTVIYSFDKLISLLAANNPNTLELLGLKPEHYLYIDGPAWELLKHEDWFLSKRVIKSFGGFIKAQRTRIENGKLRREPNKIAKHMMHIVRLYYTGIDLLAHKQMVTYRDKERKELIDIRNGDLLYSTGEPKPDFYQLVNILKREFDAAAARTTLPDVPNSPEIIKFVLRTNYQIMEKCVLSKEAFNGKIFNSWKA